METPLKSEHLAAGAQLIEANETVLPETFAGFDREYRAGRDRVALLDTNWHAITALTGPDRVRYLNAIVSNNVQALPHGRGCLALLLSPQGRILAELEIYSLSDKLLVLSHVSVRERTHATMDKYIIMDDVHLEDVTDKMASVALEGPLSGAIVEQACGVAIDTLPEFAIADTSVVHTPCHLIRRSHFGLPGAEFVTRRDRVASLWKTLLGAISVHEGEPMGMGALNSLRLEAGIPWFPMDFNDTVIPHEAAIESTHISFSKGCYTGQEIVERVRSRGHVNRRRVGLKFTTIEPPAVGARMRAGTTDVGIVTSSAMSPRAGTPIGMGYLRNEQAEPGTDVECEDGLATVTVFPEK